MSVQTLDATVCPSALDHVAGMALRVALEVRAADQWAVCLCTDGRHREADLLSDPLWGEGGFVDRVVWRDSRAQAAQDLLLTDGQGAHRVVRRARIVFDGIEEDR